jgi:Pentapeptide repeats (9 copies)
VSWQGLNLDLTGVVFDGGDFRGAEFTGGEVRFDWAQFTGGTVDFRQVAVWKMRRNSIGTTRHHRSQLASPTGHPAA